MNRLQALALVATLQAAFPAGNAGEETAQLYATMFERFDAEQAERAVRNMIVSRKDAFLPTWAEIQEAVIAEHPRPKALPEPAPVDPTPEQWAVLRAVMTAGEKRTSELQHGVRLRYARDQAKETA